MEEYINIQLTLIHNILVTSAKNDINSNYYIITLS